MADLGWLSNQAHGIHDLLGGMFYPLITVFLCLSLFFEYFKWPLGSTPAFPTLVGRALIAVLLFHTYADATNTLANFSDAFSSRLGDFNQFQLVLSKMGDRLGELSWSWVSVRDTLTLVLSFVTFFLLYFSVHVVEAFLIYSWTLLYVFSPFLIALYIFPVTAGATSALYRSLIEVCCWKVVWSILATLVWSAALSDINQPGHDIHFVAAISFNLILAGSLLLTPLVVHSLAGQGISSLAKTVGGIAVGATMIGPAQVARTGMRAAKSAGSVGANAMARFKESSALRGRGGPGLSRLNQRRSAYASPASGSDSRTKKKPPSRATSSNSADERLNSDHPDLP